MRKSVVAWQREGGGFIPAMADILLARPGASEEKNTISLTIIDNNKNDLFLKSLPFQFPD